jgi:transposase
MKNISKVFIGVDVSKDNLDIYIHPVGKRFTIANSAIEVKKLSKNWLHITLGKLHVKQPVVMKNCLRSF